MELDVPKFKMKSINKYSLKDKYRIWFSFFDPVLRCFLLKQILNKNISKEFRFTKKQEKTSKNYYSFMEEEKKQKVFDEIFST